MTEFGFIDGVKALCATLPANLFEGIGDDCAVLPISAEESLLFTADMLVERVHFLREATSAYDLGRKSLTVNLSDVAAMGARPVATLLSLSLPEELSGEWIEEFMRGYTDLSRESGVALIGGDTTASKGDLSINVTAIGRTFSACVKRRSGAKVGDTIFVTAPLGGSGVGLSDILRGEFESKAAMLHKRPIARIEEGVWLGQQGCVHSMMDISDGVASDLGHILKASGVGAVVELGQVPRYQGATIHQALCSGEDYELLFTASDGEQLAREYRDQFGREVYAIGEIVEGGSIVWLSNGELVDGDFRGFTHY